MPYAGYIICDPHERVVNPPKDVVTHWLRITELVGEFNLKYVSNLCNLKFIV